MSFHTEGSELLIRAGDEPSRFALPPEVVIVEVTAEGESARHAASLGIGIADLPALLLSQNGKLRVAALRVTPEEVATLTAGDGVAAERILVYGAGWCPDCRNAKRILGDADLSYDEVDIDGDAASEREVVLRSGGRRVIPTLAFDGRIWAFNPSAPWLRRLVSRVAPTPMG